MSSHRSILGTALIGLCFAVGCVDPAPRSDTMSEDDEMDARMPGPDGVRSDASDVPQLPVEDQGPAMNSSTSATAVLAPTEGSEVEGSVVFVADGRGSVRIEGEVSGLSPGLHGFHVHETGDCSAPDASSAGDHFAPDGNEHGAPSDDATDRHAGDLGNIEAGPEGIADIDRTDDVITLDGPESIVGRALIVHEGTDNFESQSSGEAGPRRACAVIVASR